MSLGPMGMNTGFDINTMVNKIVQAERAPKQQSLNNKQDHIDSNISAYGRLRESLDTMKNLMSTFRQEKAFAARKVDSSDEKVVLATATTEAIAGSYSIDVMQLAQSHKLASEPIAKETKFGAGKLHVSSGGKSIQVEVQSGSKLTDIVRSINEAKNNPGIRASIINDVKGARLVIASTQSGEKHQINVHVDAKPESLLHQFEYKTLEERVKALEKARAEAQQLISPLTPEQQKIAATVADKIANAAKQVDQELAQEAEAAAQKALNPYAQSVLPGELSEQGLQAAADAAAQAKMALKPQERIPGWTETASGTLLDSYTEPVPELDAGAQAKSPDIPGWSNTASGTLIDSYVTPKEAQAQLDAQLVNERLAISQAVADGNMSEQEAKDWVRSQLSDEEREAMEKVEALQRQLQEAQDSYDAYQGMIQVQAAQDSQVLLDGVAQLSSENNVIENAIDGINLTIKGKTSSETPTEISVEYNRDSVRDDIKQFVAAYNQFYMLSKELSMANPQTGAAGPLAGDSIVRSIDSRLKGVFSSKIEQAPEHLKSLTEFGITTTRQGTLEINEEMLNRQLNNNFNKLGDFFGGNQGFAKRIEDAIQSMVGTGGAISTREKSLNDQSRRLMTDQDQLDRRMDTLEQRTYAKFSAMQDVTGKMQSQLANMMNALG